MSAITTHQKTYVMRDSRSEFYKIGKSVNPSLRERTLSYEIPTIETLIIIEANVESLLHSHFDEKRIRGEWFDLTKDDLVFVSNIKSFMRTVKNTSKYKKSLSKINDPIDIVSSLRDQMKITRTPIEISSLVDAGKEIRRVRKENGLTLDEMSKHLEIGKMSLSFMENGKDRVGIMMLRKTLIKLGLKLPLDLPFDGDEEKFGGAIDFDAIKKDKK